MGAAEELLGLERQGWQALSREGAARGFYEHVLADEVRMLLPGGMVLDDRAAIVDALSGPPWSAYELDGEAVLALGADAGIVSYGAVARRGDAPPYSALMASAYARQGGRWRLVLHQQTPR